MQDPVAMFAITILYVAILWLILYQIELRFRPMGKLLCFLGIHKYKVKKLGKTVRQYKCDVCTKPKSHPHLTVIDGGNKKLEDKFKF